MMGWKMEMTAFQRANRENLVALFEGGDKYSRAFGFELEHVLLRAGDHAPVAYGGQHGVQAVLERLARHYDERHFEGENLVGLSRPGAAITIEPAAQLELSAGPFHHVGEIEAAYCRFRDELDPVLVEFGIETPMLGYNPSACARDLALVPKYRYECMTEFLGAQAYAGLCMMRGTASVQVSIDYRSEADALHKLRVAEKLAPVLALVCDNAPVFEGERVAGHMARTGVWSGMKQDRVGTVPGSLDPGFTFADYASYILSREAVLVLDEGESRGWRYVADTTFDELYADREMTRAELEHALSMVWPDARLKNFVEIRPADAMPIEYCLGYAALIGGLFYDDGNLGELDSRLASVDEEQVRQAKGALMQYGYGAEVYGMPAAAWADLLVEMASRVLDEGERGYLAPLASLVERRTTLAELYWA